MAADKEVMHKIQSLAPDFIFVKSSVVMLLGIPTGNEHSMNKMLSAKLQEIQRGTQNLST